MPGQHTEQNARRLRIRLAQLLAENVRMRHALLQITKTHGATSSAHQIARRCLDTCRLVAAAAEQKRAKAR